MSSETSQKIEKLPPITRTLRISRKKWYRGKEGSMLVVPPGVSENESEKDQFCCIGIYLGACGLTREQMKLQCTAYALQSAGRAIPDEAKWTVDEADDVYEANDDIYRFESEAQREATIKAEFRRHGVRVIFGA